MTKKIFVGIGIVCLLIVLVLIAGLFGERPKKEEKTFQQIGKEKEGEAVLPQKLPPEKTTPEGELTQEPLPTEPGEETLLPEQPEVSAPPKWLNPEKPTQSPPVEEKEIPAGAIRIGVSAKGFSPSSFTVKKGEKVTLAVTSEDEWVHVFKFKDPSLKKIALGLAPHQTRIITFYAPQKAGEYEFYCDVPGHQQRGEKGVMIVK